MIIIIFPGQQDVEGDTGLPSSSFGLGTFQRDKIQLPWD